MSKQLLIESCEIVSKVKLNKSLKESVKLSQGKNGTLIVRNIPCTILNKRNLKGRISGAPERCGRGRICCRSPERPRPPRLRKCRRRPLWAYTRSFQGI